MAFLGGIGPVISAIGSLVSGIAGLAAANYQAKVAKMNEQVALDNSRRAIERSRIEAESQDRLTLGMLGEQEAAQSASGVSLTSKSFVLTRKAAKELGRLDTLNVIQAGEIESYNYKVDAANQKAQAQLAKASGINSLLGGFIGATQSLIGGSKSTTKNMVSRNDPWWNMRKATA